MSKTTFAVRDEYIQLDQLLKATNLVSSGGQAHVAVAAGRVRVDGQLETRKRAKLRPGQRVEFDGNVVELIPAATPD
jgi:ribosome-associated protein